MQFSDMTQRRTPSKDSARAWALSASATSTATSDWRAVAQRALRHGTYSYKNSESMLKCNLDTLPEAEPSLRGRHSITPTSASRSISNPPPPKTLVHFLVMLVLDRRRGLIEEG